MIFDLHAKLLCAHAYRKPNTLPLYNKAEFVV